MEGEKKKLWEETITCPHCQKDIIIKKIRTIIEEPVKGEYKDSLKIEKSAQTKL